MVRTNDLPIHTVPGHAIRLDTPNYIPQRDTHTHTTEIRKKKHVDKDVAKRPDKPRVVRANMADH